MTLYNELSQSFPDSEMYAKSMSRLLFLKKFFLDSEFEEKEIRLEKKIGDIYKSQEKRKSKEKRRHLLEVTPCCVIGRVLLFYDPGCASVCNVIKGSCTA